MNIKGVIFDFNGTLVFDTHLHNQAWDIFLSEHSITLRDTEKNQKIHGKNNVEILSNLFTEELTKDDIKHLSIEKERIYQSLFLKEEIELAPGAEDFMDFLLLEKVPFTIATASGLYNLEFYFKHLNLQRYFDISKVVYSNGTVPSKPNPECFLRAMDILNVGPNQTLIFEDSSAGILAAENSGVEKIIIVKSTNHNYANWKHDVVQSFSEVKRNLFITRF